VVRHARALAANDALLWSRGWGSAGLAVVAWGVLGYAVQTGRVQFPHADLALIAAAALACVALALPHRRPSPPVIGAACGLMLVSLAFFVTPKLVGSPQVAAGGLAAVVLTPVCMRIPEYTLLAALFLSASFSSFEAFLGSPAAPYIDMLLAALWLALLWRLAIGASRGKVFAPLGVVLLVAYVFVTAAQVFTAPSVATGLNAFHITGWYILVVALVAFSGWSQDTYRRLAKGMVAIAVAIGGYAVLRMIIGPALSEARLAAAIPNNFFVNGKLGLFGSFDGRHHLAGWCGVAIPFAALLAVEWRGRWRMLAIAAGVLCAIALFRTEVRAGFVGALIGISALGLRSYARSTSGLRLGTVLLAVSVVLAFGSAAFVLGVPHDPLDQGRYPALLHPGSDESYRTRTKTWSAVITDLEHHPFGHGLGTAGPIQQKSGREVTLGSQPIDNSYLETAYQQGIWVAVLLLIAIIVLVAGLVHRALVLDDPERAGLALASVAALASWAFIISTGDYIDGPLGLFAWIAAGMGTAQCFAIEPAPVPVAPHMPAPAAPRSIEAASSTL
jgi:hypothetical protein